MHPAKHMTINKSEDIWADDLIDRKSDAKFLKTYLAQQSKLFAENSVDRSFVLNIDSGWGQGKTFFLSRLKREVEEDGHLTVMVDAWKEDFAEDPLVAVMAAIDRVISATAPKKSLIEKAWKKTVQSGGEIMAIASKGAIKKLAGTIITAGAVDAISAVMVSDEQSDTLGSDKIGSDTQKVVTETLDAAEKALTKRARRAVDDHNDALRATSTFRKSLVEFVEAAEAGGIPAPLYVFIDELDRCRPTYAIQML